MVEITEENPAILYFDRRTDRNSKNRKRLLGSEDFNGCAVVPVSRAVDMGSEKGAMTLIEQKDYAAYILHESSDCYDDVLTHILLSASDKKRKPKIGIITPNGLEVEALKEEAESIGVEAMIVAIPCHPDGYFQGNDCRYSRDGRKTIMRLLDN